MGTIYRLRLLFVAVALGLPVAALLARPTPTEAAESRPDFRISAGTSIRLEGQGPVAFGGSIGLDFRSGMLRAAWADNSISAEGDLDLAAAAVAVADDGGVSVGPTVSVTEAAEDQAGASLAIDPTSASRVLAAARTGTLFGSDAGVLRARSVDSGVTWVTETDPVGISDFVNSPEVACDGFGNCFLGFVDASDPFNPQLRLSLSVNGGQSFTPVTLPDSPGFEADLSLAVGPGSVWVVFESFDNAPRLRTLAAAVTGLGSLGAFTRQEVPTSPGRDMPDIAIGPAGKALVVTEHIKSGTLGFVEASVDPDGLGSAGFGVPVRVTSVGEYPEQPMPQAAWDRTRDRAYVVYRHQQSESQSRDVLLRSSGDAGATWSAAVRVNDDVPSEDRLIPNVAVDPSTGQVGVAWYDFRAGPGRAQLFGRVVTTGEQPPSVPARPTNLRARAISRSRIDLSWTDASQNETRFVIKRSTEGGAFQVIATVPADTVFYSDTGLQAGTTYAYRVRACNQLGCSRPSKKASATTPLQ